MNGNEFWKFQLPGTIEWRLKGKSPREVAVGPAPGWNLLTPYAMLDANFWFPGVRDIRRLENGDLWLTTDAIVLRATGMTKADREASGLPAVAKTLQALRYVARQFTLPERFSALSKTASDQTAPVDGPGEVDVEGLFIRDYVLPTAITDEHLDALALFSPGFSPPASVLVMLDALLATIDQDFRKALLYGAIAVESFASSRLADEYARALSGRDPRLRVIDIPIGSGNVVTKDPIYESLGEDNFSRMLHERPLYLLSRSLFVEDAATFTKAQRLYRTRNKLAHTGETPPNADTFDISEQGAVAGLQTAIQILNWFGDKGPYYAGINFVGASDGKPLRTAG